MKISKKLSSCFVCCLPRQLQTEVKREVYTALKASGIYSKEEVKACTAEAMASRVCDLADCIEIDFF